MASILQWSFLQNGRRNDENKKDNSKVHHFLNINFENDKRTLTIGFNDFNARCIFRIVNRNLTKPCRFCWGNNPPRISFVSQITFRQTNINTNHSEDDIVDHATEIHQHSRLLLFGIFINNFWIIRKFIQSLFNQKLCFAQMVINSPCF